MLLWIRLMTWSRLPLAAAVGLTWIFGKFEIGAWLFAIGLLTKAADTPLSVWRKCPIPADDGLYRLVAVMFNAAAVLGLTGGLCNAQMHGRVPTALVVFPILPLAFIVATMAITRLFIQPHSVLAKARSGFVSTAIIAFAAPMTPLWLTFISLGLIWLGDGYKTLYYADNPRKE